MLKCLSAEEDSVCSILEHTADHGKSYQTKYYNPDAVLSVGYRAPLIRECYANFECRIYDKRMLSSYSFFILEVVKAHVPKTPKYPKTVHYTGDGVFMISGEHAAYPKKFRPENL